MRAKTRFAKGFFAGLFLAATLCLPQAGLKAEVIMVDLGTASGFAVLAGTGITNAGLTTITGDVGSSPVGTTAGFGTVVLDGTNHQGDAVTVAAKFDLDSAYEDAVGRTPDIIYGAIFDLGGLTLASGVYNNPSSFSVTGTLTLDALGDSDAVWIFQAGSTFATAANSSIVLTGGALASHVFWQVGSSATLGADTGFVGNLLSFTSISMGSGSTVEGRLLARGGAVTLVNNSIVIPEPRTWQFLGAGLVMLSVLRGRRYSVQ